MDLTARRTTGSISRSTPGRHLACAALAATGLVLGGPLAGRATAQTSRAWGRLSFFTDSARVTPGPEGGASLTTFIGTATYRSAELAGDGVEFAVDSRGAGYSREERDPRVSVYEAWMGVRRRGGRLAVRGGHLWIADLGALGSLAGAQVEWRSAASGRRVRIGGFGGLEPRVLELGYARDVRRYGGYVTVEGDGFRRHTAGYVTIRHGALTERSVLTTTNYVPVGRRVFIYQSAEVDLRGPGGQGRGGLAYAFANARVTPARRLDVQATYHRGRSIDARTITQDILDGRPVADKALEGLLFESLSTRVTVEIVRGTRVHATIGRDRTSHDSESARRLGAGVHVSNLARTGVDAAATYSRIDRGLSGTYDAYYVSVGRSIGPRVYLSGDYTSSLSLVRFTRSNGLIVETRPETDRLSGSAVVNVTSRVSLLLTVDRTAEVASTEHRVLAGLSYRLP